MDLNWYKGRLDSFNLFMTSLYPFCFIDELVVANEILNQLEISLFLYEVQHNEIHNYGSYVLP